MVLWDWIISLPREYRFVRFSTRPSVSLLTFYLGMENSLDSSQDSVSLLPVSLCGVLIVSYIQKFYLLSYWVITVVPYLLYCFVVDHSRETCERIYKVSPPRPIEIKL